MANLDIKFYWAVFLRRLPYFAVITAFLLAVAVTVALILPPVYQSTANMLVEPQQIPDELAQSMVPVDPYEQAQIIEQRLMTRTNLLALADRVGLYADLPEDEQMSANAIVRDMRDRIEFVGFVPDVTQLRGVPGAIIIGVAFDAPTAELANKGANELISLVLQENVRLRTGRAGDTLAFFNSEVERLAGELQKKSEEIAVFKTAHVSALPDSMATRRTQQEGAQQRLLDLEREESSLRNQRATVVWVFERTGRAGVTSELSPEEQELQNLQSQLAQQQAIYRPESAPIRTLQSRIAVLQKLVDQQQAARALPDANGDPTKPLSELDVELAPIDEQLKYIADQKAAVNQELADLDASIRDTPGNEMVLTGMERELQTLQDQYNAAVASRGQAQVGERIEVLSKGERFSLIEAPTMPNGPYSPNRLLISAAGVVGGIGAGTGFVILMEMLNRSIRRPVDLAAGLGIQPFATVPYIRTRRETRWKRSLVVAALLLVMVVIPAALFAVHTYYMPLDLLWSETLGDVDTTTPAVEPGAPAPATATAPAAPAAAPAATQ